MVFNQITFSEDNCLFRKFRINVILFSKKLISLFLITDNSEPIQTCNLSSNDLVLYYRNYISEGSVRLDFHTDNTIEAHGFRLKISQGKYLVTLINLKMKFLVDTIIILPICSTFTM